MFLARDHFDHAAYSAYPEKHKEIYDDLSV